MQITFTAEALRDLPVPARLPSGAVNQTRFWDSSMPGFGVRVSSNGKRRWIFQTRINGRTKVFTLSRGLDLAGARAEAYRLREAVAGRGAHQAPSLDAEPTSPAGTPPATVSTFGSALEKFLTFADRERRPATAFGYRQFAKHLDRLADSPVESITRRDIAAAVAPLRDAGKNITANRVIGLVSAALAWTARRGELSAVPDLKRLMTRQQGRGRHLCGDSRTARPSEIPLLLAAAANLPVAYKAFVWMLILTGCRKTEISNLRDAEIIRGDALGARIALPAARCKNAQAFEIPLGPFAAKLLDDLPEFPSGWIFEASRGGAPIGTLACKRALLQEITRLRAQFPERFAGQLIEPWCWHDLRRTAATGWRQFCSAPFELIDSALNHKSGIANQGTRGIYIHDDDWQERRALAEKWERYLLETAAADAPLQQAA